MANRTAVNNLLRTAQAARDKQLAYNDQAAAYDWNLSAKTQEDLDHYLGYLNKRQTSTDDPSRALTVQSKMVDARRTYTSAEVGRQTIAVLYGDQGNRDKYAKINALMDQAAQNGDASLVQQLDETRARLSKTIQDEEQAAADKAAARGRAAYSAGTTATAKGITDRLQKSDILADQYKGLVAQGKMSALQYEDKTAQLAAMKADAYQRAFAGEFGPLTEDKANEYQRDYLKLQNSPEYMKAQHSGDLAANGVATKYSHFGSDNLASLKDLKDTNPFTTKDSAGNPVIAPGFGLGYTGAAKDLTKNAQGSEFILNHYLPGDPSNGVDASHSPAGFDTHVDPNTGQPYYIDAVPGKNSYGHTINLYKGKDAQGNDKVFHQLDPRTYNDPKVKILGPNKMETTAADYGTPAGGVGGVAQGVFEDVKRIAANKPGDSTIANDLAATAAAGGDLIHKTGDAMHQIGRAANIAGSLGGPANLIGGGLNALGHMFDFKHEQDRKAEVERQRIASEKAASDARQAQINRIAQLNAQQAQASQQAYVRAHQPAPQAPIRYNYATGTVSNGYGPLAIPQAVQQAANNPSSTYFAQKYLPVTNTAGKWYSL